MFVNKLLLGPFSAVCSSPSLTRITVTRRRSAGGKKTKQKALLQELTHMILATGNVFCQEAGLFDPRLTFDICTTRIQ